MMETAPPEGSEPHDDEHELTEAERKQEWREHLGIEPPDWRPEEEAPAVDEELLRAMLDRRLTSDEAARVFTLTLTFRSWRDAFGRILGVSPSAERDQGEAPPQ